MGRGKADGPGQAGEGRGKAGERRRGGAAKKRFDKRLNAIYISGRRCEATLTTLTIEEEKRE